MFNRSAKIRFKRGITLFAATVPCLLLGAALSFADDFPTGSNWNERDEVTGWLCVTPGCDVLRQPGNQCLCKKDNPWESKLSKLKLTCSQSRQGTWVPCPVPPDYRELLW